MQPSYSVVTGASRGLGETFARALAAQRRNLVLIARSKKPLEALARELRLSHAIQVIPFDVDLTSHPAGQQLARELEARELRVDLLVNNAGFGARGEFWELTFERQLEMIRLNSEAVVDLTFHLLPMILENRGGIINVASVAGFQPIPYAIVYAATKAFLMNFSLGLEHELRPYGVRVVTLCPGRIRGDSTTEGARDQRCKMHGIFQSREIIVREALRALDRGGGMVVPGVVNKVSVFAQRLIPRRIVPKLVARLSRT